MYSMTEASYNSWARGQCHLTPSSNKINCCASDGSTNNNNSESEEKSSSSSFYPTERCRAFDTIGYIHLPQFVSSDVVALMKLTMEQLVNDEWMPSSPSPTPSSPISSSGTTTAVAALPATASSSSSSAIETFRTDHKQVDAQGRSDYFLDSATKIHYFAEPYAVQQIILNGSTTTLKEEYKSNKVTALNKAGHALHLRPGIFREYTTSHKISQLLRELGYIDPVVPQSMYIFKQGRASNDDDDDDDGEGVGGVVTSHQDSTFLYTTPRQTCIGLWLALDDATINNGCLWVRPKSHVECIRRQFVRNPRHFGIDKKKTNDDVGDVFIGRGRDDDDDHDDDTNGEVNNDEPQMIFRDLSITNSTKESADDDVEGTQRSNSIINTAVPWEGKLPENSLPIPDCPGLYKAGFIPLPCKAGDLLVFAGALDHLSLANTTSKARHTFQLHCVEGEGGGVTWSKENWLQYPQGISFMKL